MTASRRSVGLREVVNAAPDFSLAGTYFISWFFPTAFGERFVVQIMLVMLLEFIVVHSAAFMGRAVLSRAGRWARVKTILSFGGFYTLLVAGFALAFRTWWPVAAFWGLTVNRLLPVVTGWVPDERAHDYMRRSWAAGAAYYLGGVFLSSYGFVPRFGITSDFQRALDLPGEGLWVEAPHRVVAFGFLYFTARGVSELFEHRWFQAGLPVTR